MMPAEPTLLNVTEIETCIRPTLKGMFPPDYHGPINRLCDQALSAITLRAEVAELRKANTYLRSTIASMVDEAGK